MAIVLALVLGCVTALGYKNVSAAPKVAASPMENLVKQEIKLNQKNYINLKYKEATVLKFELKADGSFKLDCDPADYNATYAQLKDELGNLIDKKQRDDKKFEWKDLKAGTYYVEMWNETKSYFKEKEIIEVPFYASSEPSKAVVLEIGIAINKGKSIQLTKIFSPDNCDEDEMVWSSDDTTIATVKNGKVKAKAKGETYIRLELGPTLMAKVKVTVTSK